MQPVFTFLKRSIHWAMLLAAVTGFIFTGCSSSAPPPTPPSNITKTTAQGDILCTYDANMVSCKGIPYAAPPVENLRFAPPADALDHTGTVLDATAFGNTCPQTAGSFGERSETEDCLFLNIFTPRGNGPYPVMVWIHGGAFMVGAGSATSYDPTALVAEDVIVVTLNYRLGALGFLADAALTDEAGESGNYGLMDQQKALEWVQANIANFNGDPNNVTIFGESAGGHSVMTHLVAPGSDGLFQQAIIQSGSYLPTQVPMAAAQAASGAAFAAAVGCTGTAADIRACYRGLTVADILDNQSSRYYPVYSGSNTTFLPASIMTALTAGEIADVPVMIGGNKDEGDLFVLLDLASGKYYATEADYNTGVATLMATDPRGLDAAAIAAYYAGKQDPTDNNRYRIAYSQIYTDYIFNFFVWVQWGQLSALTDTYAYWFTDEEAPLPSDSYNTPYLPVGAAHSFEIQYVFGTLGERGATADQLALSDAMIGYWTRFAKTGDPNGGSDPTWSPYSTGNFVIELNDPAPTASDATDFCTTHECAFWSSPPTP